MMEIFGLKGHGFVTVCGTDFEDDTRVFGISFVGLGLVLSLIKKEKWVGPLLFLAVCCIF